MSIPILTVSKEDGTKWTPLPEIRFFSSKTCQMAAPFFGRPQLQQRWMKLRDNDIDPIVTEWRDVPEVEEQ